MFSGILIRVKREILRFYALETLHDVNILRKMEELDQLQLLNSFRPRLPNQSLCLSWIELIDNIEKSSRKNNLARFESKSNNIGS